MPEDQRPGPGTTRLSLRSNLFFNFVGSVLVSLIQLIALPIYLPYIGVEAFGIAGLFIALQIILMMFDGGLSITLTRHLATIDGSPKSTTDARDLIRTTEVIYWGISLLAGTACVLLTPLLTRYVNASSLSAATLVECFIFGSLALALQFPIALYSGGLFGLQRQSVVSVVNVIFTILKYLGVLVALNYSPWEAAETFFAWQAVVTLLQVATMAACLWASVPRSPIRSVPRFRTDLLRSGGHFTAGVGITSIVNILFTQLDKVILVRILPLELFGYYAVATVAASGPLRLIQPIFQVYFPKFTQMVNEGSNDIGRSYHQANQVIAVIALPILAVLVYFSWEVMLLWQRNAEVASQTYLIVALLVAGNSIVAYMFAPYALQLAYGRTKLYLLNQVFALLVSIPATILFARAYGGVGAAIVWVAVNAAVMVITVSIMHRDLLANEKWRWLVNDLILPLVAVGLIGAICRYLFIETTLPVWSLVQLLSIYILLVIVVVVTTEHPRKLAYEFLLRLPFFSRAV